jgi:LacI family transcriptional regulator
VGIENDEQRHRWQKPAQATLNDVARLAGVSQSAASVVLNGAKSGTRISAERRRMVLEAADQIGYRANGLARSLITGRSNLIGVYSGRSRLDCRNYFFAELLGGVFEGTSQFGANTVIHSGTSEQNDLLALLTNQMLDGLVVHAGEDDPIMKVIGDIRIPAVAVADGMADLPSVIVDDPKGGKLQAQHLAIQGHRHVMLKVANFPTGSAKARLGSFQLEAGNLGMSWVERLETFGDQGGLSDEDVKLLSTSNPRITAIVAWNDRAAYAICAKLISLGISIPEGIAVVGFDGLSAEYLQSVSLTTIHAPWAEVGRVATQRLRSLIEGEYVPRITTLPVSLNRGSTS